MTTTLSHRRMATNAVIPDCGSFRVARRPESGRLRLSQSTLGPGSDSLDERVDVCRRAAVRSVDFPDQEGSLAMQGRDPPLGLIKTLTIKTRTEGHFEEDVKTSSKPHHSAMGLD